MESKEIEGYDEPIVCMSWDDVQTRSNLFDREGVTVLAMNMGAMLAASRMKNAEWVVDREATTTHVLVDVLESNVQRFELAEQFPHAKIVNLFDKTGCDANKGILVMPWEDEPRELKPRLTTSSGMTADEKATFELSQQLAESLADLEPADVDVEVIADHVGLIQTCLAAAPTRRIMQGRGVG